MIPKDERPVLANRADRYAEAPPIAALHVHFQCVWTNSTAGPLAARITVVPDGYVDLLWRDGRFVVVGPDITAGNKMLSPGGAVIGLRFRPGAAIKWLRLPMTEIVGQEVPVAEFWGREADRIADRLSEKSIPSEQAAIFQQLMADMAVVCDRPSREASAVFQFLSNRIGSNGGKIMSLHDRVNMSERTLRRWSHENFSYGPKTLQRILRFQRFRALAVADSGDELTGLAFDAGYSDQALLSREVQALRGMTAREFVRQVTA
jgi:AraC-like DNA-binding protein